MTEVPIPLVPRCVIWRCTGSPMPIGLGPPVEREAEGVPDGGVRVTRIVALLAALALLLLAAPTAQGARTEFFGIVQGTLDPQDRQGVADARVQTARFMLKWRDIERVRGSYDWSERDRVIGGLAMEGIRSVPFVWGSPSWVGNGTVGHPPIATTAERQGWQNFLRAAVTRYGPNGTYWATKYRQDYPDRRPSGADPVMADLERAQPEEVLQPRINAPADGPEVRHAPVDLLRRDQGQGFAGPGRPGRNAEHPGHGRQLEGLGLPRRPLRGARVQGRFRRRRAASLRLQPRADSLRAFQVQRLDEEPRRRGDSALAHRVRLGVGESRPVLQEQGPRSVNATCW